jgi:membrane-associated protease RseP (regulator of RpoE activity)
MSKKVVRKHEKNLSSARGPKMKLKPSTGFFLALITILLSLVEFTLNGSTETFYWLLAIGLLVFLPNSAWLTKKYANPFIIPFVLTMIRTKKFVKTIQSVAHLGKIWEKVCIAGLFLGFGLAGVDYWSARKQGGIKRIAILLVSAIALVIVLILVSQLMFPTIPPLFEPLIGISIISFIFLGFGGLSLAFMLGYGALAVSALFSGETICPSIAPVLPGVPIPGFGVAIPFIAWISLALILIIHEGSHGIMLSYYKKKLHSVGLILAGIFPIGAFVEQDDKEFSVMKEKEKICVLSAGPSFNFLTIPFAIILMLLISAVFAPMLNTELEKMYSGVKVSYTQEMVGYCGDNRIAPADGKLLEGDVLVSVNDTNILTLSDLSKSVSDANLLNVIVLRSGELKEIEIVPEKFDSLGVSSIGAAFESIGTDYSPWIGFEQVRLVITSLITILNLLWLLSLAVGMTNFIPSDPLDGGGIAKAVISPYFGFMKMSKKETEKLVGRFFTWLFIIAITLNLIPYLTLMF